MEEGKRCPKKEKSEEMAMIGWIRRQMIKKLKCAVALALLLGALGMAMGTPAEAKAPLGRCTVIGEGVATVEATSCEVRFTVTGRGADAAAARKASEAVMMRIRKATAKTATVREENYHLSEHEGFLAIRGGVCTVKDPQGAEDVRRALVEAGATDVCEGWFTAADAEAATKEATSRALEDAKAKAEALGLSGVVLSVREIPADHCPMPLLARGTAGDRPTLTVCVRLLVTFGEEADMQRIVDIPKGQVPTVSL